MTVTPPCSRAHAFGPPAPWVQILAVSSLSNFTLHNNALPPPDPCPTGSILRLRLRCFLVIQVVSLAATASNSDGDSCYRLCSVAGNRSHNYGSIPLQYADWECHPARFERDIWRTIQSDPEWSELEHPGSSISGDSQPGGSGLLQPSTNEIARNAHFLPLPKADPGALVASERKRATAANIKDARHGRERLGRRGARDVNHEEEQSVCTNQRRVRFKARRTINGVSKACLKLTTYRPSVPSERIEDAEIRAV
ncbi:hypothetical protein FN846DRAFT_889424 [Sphaerosporella brunnea]|uniref:Uncharacterized protein n=1 Tax=Sphaerosporella brunnea TaxID=1250544 RepID=A0A5J5EZT9_9PEZI|nr:hypothetical protein FN846DRAFT_889424 [Sphaerosporella brunnea]